MREISGRYGVSNGADFITPMRPTTPLMCMPLGTSGGLECVMKSSLRTILASMWNETSPRHDPMLMMLWAARGTGSHSDAATSEYGCKIKCKAILTLENCGTWTHSRAKSPTMRIY